MPRDLAAAESRYPVISESDYFKTQPSSEKALESLFSRSHVLIVGSSITDPPLIRALERTTTKEYSRWALLDGKLDGKTIASGEQQRRLMTSRLAPLKVTPVFADFHVQQAQFFRELIAANTLSDRVKSYKGDRHGKYYYSRMGNWWKALRLGSSEARTEDMQWGVHVYLSEFILPEIRDELGAHHERMKLEMWIRWDPTRDRTFRLLGSTVGVWLDHEAMRFEEIGQARKSVIIDAFREGRPTLKTGGKAYGGRWQSVLAVPVWSEQSGSPFVTAVMVLASQEPEEETALNESRNRAALAETARILQGVGIYITAPDSWWPPQ